MSEPEPLNYESREKPKIPPPDGAAYACPKCDGDMIAGFCITHSHQGGSVRLMWAKGAPVFIKFFGRTTSGLDMTDVVEFPVTTYACNKCGYVESFLRDV